MTEKQLDELFPIELKSEKLKERALIKAQAVNQKNRELVFLLNRLLPEGPEKDKAIFQLCYLKHTVEEALALDF